MQPPRYLMAKPMPAGTQGSVKEMRVQEALREALRSEMARDGGCLLWARMLRSSAALMA